MMDGVPEFMREQHDNTATRLADEIPGSLKMRASTLISLLANYCRRAVHRVSLYKLKSYDCRVTH